MTQASARYDLAIVGGGIAGVMTAVLARRRHADLNVLIIDRSLLGLGATAYTAGLGLPFGHTEGIRALTVRSTALYRELRDALPGLPIVDVPMVGVCASDRLDAAYERLTARGSRAAGGAITWALPGFAVPAGQLVLEGLHATRCNGDLVGALVASLTASPGARSRCDLLEGAEVVRISAGSGRGYQLDLHDGRAIPAERVALCMGPWLSGTLAPMTGARVETRVKKVVSLIIPSAPGADAPVIYLFEHEAFLLPQPERARWLLSIRSETWDVVPGTSELRLGADDLASATAILDRYVPDGVAWPLGARVFCDAYTATREPVITGFPDRPGVVVIGGAGGSGIRLAPAMAERGLQEIGLA